MTHLQLSSELGNVVASPNRSFSLAPIPAEMFHMGGAVLDCAEARCGEKVPDGLHRSGLSIASERQSIERFVGVWTL